MTSSSCCGCTACAIICSKKAISFKSDKEGFYVPVVDEKSCIDCGLCIDACPALRTDKGSYIYGTKAYAFQYKDDNVRSNSASGALFPAVAYHFIHNLNGYVCGCILDDNLIVRHIVSNKWEDVERMQDSKYVQSNMDLCISKVIKLLKEDQYVLFSGTSCQVSGLLSVLEKKHIGREKLLSIDFFCHGVPSPMIWKDYVEHYSKLSGKSIEGYRFRNKTYGWGKGTRSRGTGFLSLWKYSGAFHEDWRLLARIWPRIFFSNICIRQYCHHCPYTCIEKPSDITMGDFWGIEEFRPSFSDGKGCSLAVIHNSKAEKILLELRDTSIIEVSIQEVTKRQLNAFTASAPHPLREEFWTCYSKEGFKGVLSKYLNYTEMGRLRALVKYLLFKLNLRNYSY